ncbi:MAG: hypothetical protein GY714_19540 [Desulfobacterales bacterium]|nr:hypothetical protein [Desulfobacterales bacterium]
MVPEFEGHYGNKASSLIVTLCNLWVCEFVIRPVLLVVLPSLIVFMLTKENVGAPFFKLLDNSGFNNWGETVKKSAFLIITFAISFQFIAKATYEFLLKHSRPKKEIGVDELMWISDIIENIVGEKCKRMADHARETIKEDEICAKDTFKTITKPEQQINLLVVGLCKAFEQCINSKVKFRVGLLKIENNKPVEWFFYEPANETPSTTAKELCATTSTVMKCIKDRGIIIVDDIQKELKRPKNKRRFIKGRTNNNKKGSQLCFPVRHRATNDIEYVVSIAGNKKECLMEKNSELYEWIIRQFSVRVCIEHSLMIMKGKSK